MKKIENFMQPEHFNQLYKNEAISSISLVRDVAVKINELVGAINELSDKDIAWKLGLEGKVNKGIVYMKDNLINSLNELMQHLLNSGFVDDRISYHCKLINERLENLFSNVGEGSTTFDSEIIDSRLDYTGKEWSNLGDHIRYFTELLGTPDTLTREQINTTYNNLNSRETFNTGDRVYVEPISINTPLDNIKYISVLGLYGEYAEEGYDTLAMILPEHVKPLILKLEREYRYIRITYNLNNADNTIAYGIIKKLNNDLVSHVYENRIKVLNANNNYNLFEPVKLTYGAHQGYRAIAPANSLPAYEEMGKAGFEWCWIAGCRQSLDGTWYVMHDATVDNTTDGTGSIKEMSDTQIGELSIDTGVNVENYTREQLKVPTVEEVLKVCKKYGVNVCFRMASLYTNVTGISHFRSLIEFVKKHGCENAIFSGNLKQIEMLKTFTNNYHGQVYVDSGNVQDAFNMIDTYVSKGWTNMSILVSYSGTNKEVVEYCHSHGFKYVVCDIPTDEDIEVIRENVLNMGVDICQSGHITPLH